MKKKHAVLWVSMALAIGFQGCGGNGPTGPGPIEPVEVAITFLAARTDQPVAGALVQVNGIDYRTDGQGVARVKAFVGQESTVIAPGFIQPSNWALTNNLVVHLWEDDPSLPLSYTRQIVYNDSEAGRLRRPVVRRAIVGFDQPFWNSGDIRNRSIRGVELVNEADGDVQWEYIGGKPPNDKNILSVFVYVDPNDKGFQEQPNAGALTYGIYEGYILRGARIVFRSINSFSGFSLSQVVAHECGHARGLGHSHEGIMGDPYRVSGFSIKERETMHNMFLRPPGTAYPDNTTAQGAQASSSSSGTYEYLIYCEHL